MAIPNLSRNASETLSIVAPSQRLRKTEATERTSRPSPADTRRSKPRIYASADAKYCSQEKRSVTLIATPFAIDSSIAGTPLLVPGILMNRFGRFAFELRDFADDTDFFVSSARRGDSSSETKPSTPAVRS